MESSPCGTLYRSVASIILCTALIGHRWSRARGCDAFSFPRFSLAPPSSSKFLSGGGGDMSGKGRKRFFYDGDDDSNGEINTFNLASLRWISATTSDDESSNDFIETKPLLELPSGSGGNHTKETTQPEEKLYTMLFEPFRKARTLLSERILSNPFHKSKVGEQSESQSRQQQHKILSSTIVQSVSAPNSELLTPDEITQCAMESALIGGTLTPETLEATAKRINQLYLKQGYVMNCVTGATLVPSTQDAEQSGREGQVELKVREVKIAESSNRNSSPVRIRFVEKMHDQDNKGDDEKSTSLQSSGVTQSDHQTFKIVSGRTRPSKVARMVKQLPGSHFQILPERWSQLATYPARGVIDGKELHHGGRKSAIFSTIHAVRPIPISQDAVELEIVATENKPLSLEYGVTKSLYSDQWEGELDLKHTNIFGGGEIATINVRKGRSTGTQNKNTMKSWKSAMLRRPVSWKMSIKDDYLGGNDAGYDIEIFRDYVGVGGYEAVCEQEPGEFPEKSLIQNKQRKSISDESCPPLTGAMLKLRLRRPFHPFILPKAISARFECVDRFTMNDDAQCMASMSAEYGPHHHSIELSTRPIQSTITATSTIGRKWNAGAILEKRGDYAKSHSYATGTITTLQSIPLISQRSSIPSTDFVLRHVLSASTTHLPRHEAIMLGLASRIRGYKYNYQPPSMVHPQQKSRVGGDKSILRSLKTFLKGHGSDQFLPPIALSKAVSGSMEVRIPFERIMPRPVLGAGTVVVFADWCVVQAQRSPSSPSLEEKGGGFCHPLRQSSIGVGFRKTLQGIPFKMDCAITEHGTRGMFFGIGAD